MKNVREDAPDRLQVRIRLHNKSRLSLVARYLEENDYDLTQEVIKLLEARFLPEAIQQYEGKVKRNIVFECVGALEGYIRAIERSCGVAAPYSPPTQPVQGSVAPEELEELEELAPPDPMQQQRDLSKEMFGAKSLSG